MARGNWPAEPDPNCVVIYLTYHIYCRDIADCEALRNTYGTSQPVPAYVSRSPAFMRDELGISETAGGWQDPLPDRWISFPYPPSTVRRSIVDGHWLAPVGNQDLHIYVYPHKSGEPDTPYWWPPEVADNFIDYNFDWIEWAGHPSVPIWGAGPKVVWIWTGLILAFGGENSNDTPPPPTFSPIRPRRFMAGFELMRGGDGTFGTSPEGYGGTGELFSRIASRTIDGIGLAVRNGQAAGVQITLDALKSPTVLPQTGVGSFYMRIRNYPTGDEQIWQVNSGNSAILLRISSTGQIKLFTRDNFGSIFGPRFTSQVIPLNTWVKISYYYYSQPRVQSPTSPPVCGVQDDSWGNTGCNATLHLYIGGNEVNSGFGSVHIAFGTTTVNWNAESIGPITTVTYGIDFDDWIAIEPGYACLATTLPAEDFRLAPDWFQGYHLQQIKPTAQEINDYTGQWQAALQNPSWQALADLRSITAGHRIELATEMDASLVETVISILRQLGCIAVTVGMVNNRQTNNGTNGTLGANFAGGADVPKTLTAENTGLNGYGALIQVGAGLTEFPAMDTVEPIDIFKTHSTQTGEDRIRHLQVLAQLVGSFGPEDEQDPDSPLGLTDMLGIHNAPYITTFLAHEEPPPLNTAAVASGTYVGNGTLTELIIPTTGIHWFWLRNTTSDEQMCWWSSMLGPHRGLDQHLVVPSQCKFEVLPDGTTKITIVGSDAYSNQNLITYQWVAISDPLSMIMLNSALRQNAGGPFIHPFFNTEFTPEGCLFFLETQENTLGGNGAFWKGVGNAANGVKKFETASESATGASFAAGSVVTPSGSVLHSGISGAAFAAFRTNDGITADCVAITSYVGNGAGGTRVIPVSLKGRRPLFALVIPMNASAVMRDPSFSGGNSCRALQGTRNTTGITAGGINSITVGTTLNANLITYGVFVIPACTDVAGNDGWGVGGEVCALNVGGWDPDDLPSFLPSPPEVPADVSVVGEGGIVLSGDPGMLIIKDMSGIYTLIPGKTDDTVYDRQAGQTSVDLPIPDPTIKTGFV